MSTERLIAQAWASHAATTVGVERAGEFVPLAECSGHGRMSTDDEPIARRLAACWNACNGLSTEALEKLGTLDRANVSMTVQRDELLAALIAMEKRFGGSYRDQDEQPKTFGCHHMAETCSLCDGLVSGWKAVRGAQAAIKKIGGAL